MSETVCRGLLILRDYAWLSCLAGADLPCVTSGSVDFVSPETKIRTRRLYTIQHSPAEETRVIVWKMNGLRSAILLFAWRSTTVHDRPRPIVRLPQRSVIAMASIIVRLFVEKRYPFTKDYNHNQRLKAKDEKRLGTCCETDIIIFREFFLKNFLIECDLLESLNM